MARRWNWLLSKRLVLKSEEICANPVNLRFSEAPNERVVESDPTGAVRAFREDLLIAVMVLSIFATR